MSKDLEKKSLPSAILLIHCPDQHGIVAVVTEFIYKNNGNVLYLDQHVDREKQVFFMRIEWELEAFAIPQDKIGEYFDTLIGKKYDMKWQLFFSDEKQKMALFVSKFSHCLYDVLSRWHSGEWQVDIPIIVSNHPDMEPVAKQFGVEYHHFPVMPENKKYQEQKQIELLKSYDIDFIVLARYMRILSPVFVNEYENRIINIHHSFLPAFPGARPYHSAYQRGVKIIGATSHFVTKALDEGPIIDQNIVHVSHMDTVPDLIHKGKDLEKMVLSRAIWLYLQRKILVYGNRTIIFS